MTSTLETVKRNIQTAAEAAGRPARDITLVAVSKTKPIDVITPVLEAGHRIFGENKVQEAARKWPALRETYPDIELHLIGPLQSNKARQAMRIFDIIETVDRPRLARAIARISAEEGCRPRCYIQINIGREPQKAGVHPEAADAFIALCRDELKLDLQGLMCIPPAGEDPTPHFAELKAIARRNRISHLSMGMSGDYEQAIRSGATSVRVGTAIFGPRPPVA